MTHQHVLNRVLFVKRIVNMKHCAARVTPDVFDVFCLQGFDENVRSVNFYGCIILLTDNGSGLQLCFGDFHGV